MLTVLRSVWRHKGKSLVFFAAVFSGVVLATLLCPRWYQSQGAMYLRMGKENASLDPTAAVGASPVVFMPSSREREVNSVLEILKSRGMVEAVVDSRGYAAILADARGVDEAMIQEAEDTGGLFSPPLAPRDKAVLHVAKKLKTEAAEDANIVWITYEARTPEFAQEVVQTLLDTYLEKHVQFHRARGSHNFLADQTARMKAELDKLEGELCQARERHFLIAPDEQRQAVVARMARLQTELAENDAQSLALNTRVKELRAMLEKQPASHVTARTTGLPNEAADRMRDQLFSLQIREQALLARFTPENPEVVAIREQIRQTTAILAAEQAPRVQQVEGISRVHEQGNISLLELVPLAESLKTRSEALRERWLSSCDELRKVNEQEIEVARLAREVDLAEAKYRKYSAALDQARLDEALEIERISNVSIVQAPTLEPKPVRPIATLNLALGFLFALGGAVALAQLADRFAPRQRSASATSLAPAHARLMPSLAKSTS